jgi:hypothetical protein
MTGQWRSLLLKSPVALIVGFLLMTAVIALAFIWRGWPGHAYRTMLFLGGTVLGLVGVFIGSREVRHAVSIRPIPNGRGKE